MPISKVAIVGGGLVGALEACLLAKRGFEVTLFESRGDSRLGYRNVGRSINLAISHRGISALGRLDPDLVKVLVSEFGVPMEGRMIHDLSGRTTPIYYDPTRKCINSIGRQTMHNYLLDQAEQKYKVKLLFRHKLLDMKAESGQLMFRLTKENDDSDSQLVTYEFDLILGCDGSKSTVRSLLAQQTQMNLSQTYIEHGYLELIIHPGHGHGMHRNYLHIWPRGQYMMIALPNLDNSFTCTLFMPLKMFEKLKDPQKIMEFFETNFPDSIDSIGKDGIIGTLLNHRPSSLVSIKCNPYSWKNKVALLGDAAHAMVPFYGQGMNCGFEDCLVLDELMDKHLTNNLASTNDNCSNNNNYDDVSIDGGFDDEKMTRVLEDYSRIRCANGQAMCDLAMYNYIEMRDLVNSWSFRIRKCLDNLLYRIFPYQWIPLYTMVTFSRIPIDQCVERRKTQDKILNRCMIGGSIFLVGLGVPVSFRILSSLSSSSFFGNRLSWKIINYNKLFHFQ